MPLCIDFMGWECVFCACPTVKIASSLVSNSIYSCLVSLSTFSVKPLFKTVKENLSCQSCIYSSGVRLLSKHFCVQLFSPKIQFLYCLLSSVALRGDPMVDNEGEIFEIHMCKLLESAFFLDFSWNFRVLWGVSK